MIGMEGQMRILEVQKVISEGKMEKNDGPVEDSGVIESINGSGA